MKLQMWSLIHLCISLSIPPTQELVSGEPVLVDLSEESDGEDQDFDSWKPDPVDADPSE